MILVELVYSKGFLKGFRICGHENVKKGQVALICAAISSSIRSFIRVCEKNSLSFYSSVCLGFVEFRLDDEKAFSSGWYKGASMLFLQILEDLKKDFSSSLVIREREL